jgi:type IV pilus assembly protein PilQ
MKARSVQKHLLLMSAAAVAIWLGGPAQKISGFLTIAEAAEAPSGAIESRVPVEELPPLPPASSNGTPMRMPGDQPLMPPIEPPAQLLPAKILKEIEVDQQNDAVNILLKGDGDFSYEVSRLTGNRLVVDLEDVINATRRRTVPVGHPLLTKIRIGSHLQPHRKVRLVLDLPRAVPYTIEKHGQQLQIVLTSPGSVAAAMPEAESAADADKRELEKAPARSLPAVQPAKAPDVVPPPAPAVVPPVTKPRPVVAILEGSERYSGKRISLDFQDADISSVLRLIADVSGFNMVVGEGARAKVTLKLLNVPWDQALELILKLNQLGQIREGNIIWIDSLANIAKQKDEAVRAHEATVKAEPLGTRIMYLNYADAQKTLDIVKSNLSTRGEAKVDLRTNALVVKDIAEHLRKVEKLLRDLDRVTPQVQIEARIVQASKSFARGIGVQWGISSINSQRKGLVVDATTGIALPGQHEAGPVTVNLGRAGAAFSTDATASTFLVNLPSTSTGVNIPTSALGLTIGRFLGTTGTLDLRLSAGESLGLTKIVSAPKIVTLDHKPAKIEQGSQVPFQTTSLQGTQTTFVDATLTLNVTPHVIPFAQTIRLEIKATKNSIGAAVSQAGPTIDKKEATTEVLLRDGETTVLGGIFEETRTDNTQGIPWFNRIPFLGWLFKTEGVSLSQTELLVFVTPIILKD